MSTSSFDVLPVPVPSPSPGHILSEQNRMKRESEHVSGKGESNILVAVRCRPLSDREMELGSRAVVSIVQGKLVVIKDPTMDDGVSTFFRKNRVQSYSYAFDHAFDFEATQQEIFNNTTQALVPIILDGYV